MGYEISFTKYLESVCAEGLICRSMHVDVDLYMSCFSDNCIQPDDGQKQYWPKHVFDMLCIIDNIVML